jgi:hypothetical protein
LVQSWGMLLAAWKMRAVHCQLSLRARSRMRRRPAARISGAADRSCWLVSWP